MAHPSPNANRVHLGKHYTAPRFERRFSDGRYEAFMTTSRSYMVDDPPPVSARLLVLSVALVAALAAVVIVMR